jgi:hypothetical protein
MIKPAGALVKPEQNDEFPQNSGETTQEGLWASGLVN